MFGMVLFGYAAFHAYILVAYVIPPYNGIAGWIAIVVLGGIPVIGSIYYMSVLRPSVHGEWVRSDGKELPGSARSAWLLRKSGVSCEIVKEVAYNKNDEAARRFGTRRKVEYRVGLASLLRNWSSSPILIYLAEPQKRLLLVLVLWR